MNVEITSDGVYSTLKIKYDNAFVGDDDVCYNAFMTIYFGFPTEYGDVGVSMVMAVIAEMQKAGLFSYDSSKAADIGIYDLTNQNYLNLYLIGVTALACTMCSELSPEYYSGPWDCLADGLICEAVSDEYHQQYAMA